MGACRRTLQEGFSPAALAPVCLTWNTTSPLTTEISSYCDLRSPPTPNVSTGATPLILGYFVW